jgi:hypothetical protein
MLFTDILNKKTQELQPEFDKLFDDILKNQTHDGDLLLTRINGFYYPEANNWDNTLVKNSYMIGPNTEGHSDHWHYKFIHNYRQNAIANVSYEDYLKKFEWSEARAKEIEVLTESEATSIQLEMLIYLKIWEADLFIKKLYQLTKLSLGEPYDWHFKIKESSRDTSNTTGKREEIIRLKIRDRIKDKYPNLFAAIKNAYKTQIRNSIAHSNYYFIGRYIHPSNFIKNDAASQIQVLSFNEWIDMFHDTMVIYNQLIRFSHLIDNVYSKAAHDNNLLFEVRLNRIDPIEKTEYYILKYRPEFNDWGFNRE